MRIAIIGGGAAGVLAAAHIARRRDAGSTEILILEPKAAIGPGLAYSTQDPGHLLNVSASSMSAFADEPGHLLEWLRPRAEASGASPVTPQCFIPRQVYGEYLSDLANQLLANGAARHVRARCADAVESARDVEIRTEAGDAIRVDQVVLATGNDAKPPLAGLPAEQPWSAGALDDLPVDAPILIVGSGLTMLDMTLSLARRGHVGKICVLSRRGLLPSAHRQAPSQKLARAAVPFGAEVSDLLRWLRALARDRVRDGGDWRSAIDALRPHSGPIWRAMSTEQRRRFIRHARPYWDIHRHRMAPEIDRRLEELRSSGRFVVVAGRIRSARRGPNGVEVEVAPRGERRTATFNVARVIDCTGLADDVARSANPLIRELVRRGDARPDPLGIGLDISEDFALIDARGETSRRVRAIGPLARAAFWECIAIPDIRLQCGDLAESFVDCGATSGRQSQAAAN